MDKINELQDNIQNLQTQINATQAQINDYKTNPKYQDYYYACKLCGRNNGKDSSRCKRDGYPFSRITYFFTKVSELANAESSLNSLQNQLKSTQDALDSLLQDKQAQIQATLTQANAKSIPTPPPNANYKQYKSFARNKFFAKHFSPRHKKTHKPHKKRVILGFFRLFKFFSCFCVFYPIQIASKITKQTTKNPTPSIFRPRGLISSCGQYAVSLHAHLEQSKSQKFIKDFSFFFACFLSR